MFGLSVGQLCVIIFIYIFLIVLKSFSQSTTLAGELVRATCANSSCFLSTEKLGSKIHHISGIVSIRALGKQSASQSTWGGVFDCSNFPFRGKVTSQYRVKQLKDWLLRMYHLCGVCVCAHVRVRACAHVHASACMHAHVCVRARARARAHVSIFIWLYSCVVHVFVCLCGVRLLTN